MPKHTNCPWLEAIISTLKIKFKMNGWGVKTRDANPFLSTEKTLSESFLGYYFLFATFCQRLFSVEVVLKYVRKKCRKADVLRQFTLVLDGTRRKSVLRYHRNAYLKFPNVFLIFMLLTGSFLISQGWKKTSGVIFCRKTRFSFFKLVLLEMQMS